MDTPNTTETPNQPETPDLMGYEPIAENMASQVELPKNDAKDTQTIINEAVKEVTVDKEGKYVYPDDMDPVLKAAVAATKSYRDNQSGFTKSQQNLKESEAENEALREQLAKTSQPLELTQEVQTELADLLQTDPNAWRAKMNSLEAEQGNIVDTVTEEARRKASGEYELEQRYSHLEEINKDREVKITPELLDTDVPPRITKKLADGEVTFGDYIAEVIEYVDAGKVVSKTPDTTTTDLNKANGSSVASDEDKEKQGELDYSSQTF